MELFEEQIIASTHQDSQGENFELEELKEFFDDLNDKRTPVGQEHDFGKPFAGYIENPKIIEDKDSPGVYLLKADIYCDKENLENVLHGFSVSTVEALKSNSADPKIALYFSYPLYNNEAFLDSFLESDLPLQVGKWRKKGVSPEQVNLIVNLIFFALSPLWAKFFNKYIVPYLEEIQKDDLFSSDLDFDYIQNCKDKEGREFRIYFKSKKKNLNSLRPYVVKTGIKIAFDFISNDDKASNIGIAMLRLKFDNSTNSYKLGSVHYKDGSYQNLP